MGVTTQTATTIEAVGFITIGHYGMGMRPGQFATMPPDRADYFVNAGLARVVTKTPPDAVIAPYTEHDFRLPAEPSQPVKLTREETKRRLKMDEEQLQTAIAFCGFPAPTLTTQSASPRGTITITQYWREDHVILWRDRVASLRLG